jgi:UDP-N-acetyl-D-mannosaminuronic acid dehydrogenase
MAHLVGEALAAAGRRLKGARVVILGFAYREDTEDSRDTPAVSFVRELRRRGADVVIHDPYAKSERGYTVTRDLKAAVVGADALAIVTAHSAYRKLDLRALGRRMRRKVLVDGRNLFRGPEVLKAGFEYRGIGKGEY